MKFGNVPAMLLRQVELLDSGLVDMRIANGVISAIAPSLAASESDQIIEATGQLLLPGLSNHHLHLFATASAMSSIDCAAASIKTETDLAEVIQQAVATGNGWLRGTGFDDTLAPNLDRHWLDSVCSHRPIRIQHHSGMLWVLNSAALEQLQLPSDLPEGVERDATGQANGRFYNLDDWLGGYLPRQWPNLRPLSQALAACGVTHVTDTGVNNNQEVWQALAFAQARGELRQHCLLMGKPDLTAPQAPGYIELGPVKLYLREAALPELDEFTQQIIHAHENNRAVAVHCVTLVELYFCLAAFEAAGVIAGDRIEHASVCEDHALQWLARLGLTVVSQPNFIAERGDRYLRDVDPHEQPYLYRAASFIKAGVPYAIGSDSPYGGIDPWAAMHAAVNRTTANGHVIGVSERLTSRQALAACLGSAHRPGSGVTDSGAADLQVGQVADLVLMDCSWPVLERDLSAKHVAMTLCAGSPIFVNPSIEGRVREF